MTHQVFQVNAVSKRFKTYDDSDTSSEFRLIEGSKALRVEIPRVARSV
jgi:hypothetical protein